LRGKKLTVFLAGTIVPARIFRGRWSATTGCAWTIKALFVWTIFTASGSWSERNTAAGSGWTATGTIDAGGCYQLPTVYPTAGKSAAEGSIVGAAIGLWLLALLITDK
jgi:hypothetical protein